MRNHKLKRRNPYSTTDEQLTEAIKTSTSMAQVLTKLGLTGGGNHRTVKKRVVDLGLDTSHFTGQAWLKGQHHNYNSMSLTEMFVEHSTCSRSAIKRRLLQEGLLTLQCSECGIGPEWNGKKLTLQLDHINGVWNDNRLENLRILCPNCHTQTPTYCSRNSARPKLVDQATCIECGIPVYYLSERCRPCEDKRKQGQPTGIVQYKGYDFSLEETLRLRDEILSSSIVRVAKNLDISSHAVRNALKKHGLYNELPNIGKPEKKRPSKEKLVELLAIKTRKEIAEELDVARKTVYNWVVLYGLKEQR